MVKKTTLYNSDNEKLYPRTSAECVGYGDGTVKDALDSTGVGDYPAFSASTAYSAGDVVNYNGKLYKFTADHAAGAWNENEVRSWSLKKDLTQIKSSLHINDFQSGFYNMMNYGGYVNPTISSSESYVCKSLKVFKGDVIYMTLKGYNSSGARIYAFTDLNNKILDLAGNNVNLSNKRIDVNEEGFLYINLLKKDVDSNSEILIQYKDTLLTDLQGNITDLQGNNDIVNSEVNIVKSNIVDVTIDDNHKSHELKTEFEANQIITIYCKSEGIEYKAINGNIKFDDGSQKAISISLDDNLEGEVSLSYTQGGKLLNFGLPGSTQLNGKSFSVHFRIIVYNGYRLSSEISKNTANIKTIQNELYGDIQDVETELMTDQYYLSANNSGLVERTSADYNITKYIQVQQGDIIEILASGSANNVCLLGFKKTITDNSISDFPVDEILVVSKGDNTEATVTIEDDGYIVACYRNNADFSLKLKTESVLSNIANLKEVQKELQDDVKELQENVDIKTPSNPLDSIITDGGDLGIFTTVGQIGDSLASGEMAYADAKDENATKYVDMYDQSWLSFIGRAINRTIYNFSRGGASTTSFLAGETAYPPDYMDGANIFDTFQEKKCQAYFIALAHNDRNNVIRSEEYTSAVGDEAKLAIIKAAVGSPSDITDVDNIISNNTDTFYVRYAKIIKHIKQIQPYAKIFPITCKTGRSKNNQWEKEGWNDAIRYMAEIFDDIYIIDMGKWAENIPSWHYTQGHGNAMGYRTYGNEIATYADWIIRNNRNLFKYTSFIGTDIQDVAIISSSMGSVGSEWN